MTDAGAGLPTAPGRARADRAWRTRDGREALAPRPIAGAARTTGGRLSPPARSRVLHLLWRRGYQAPEALQPPVLAGVHVRVTMPLALAIV